jgi:hypothetical protein
MRCISDPSALLYVSAVVSQYIDQLVNYAVVTTDCICQVQKLATEFHVFIQNNANLYPV